ncbi:MAG: hypothetical protein R3C44_19720 [Chloroflexota bacterium]
MNEKQSKRDRKGFIWLALTGILLVGLLGAGFMLAGRALAQAEPTDEPTTTTDEPMVHELVERVISGGDSIVISGQAGIGFGFPFETALRKLATEGVITNEDVDSIMEDLSAQTDAVTFSSSTSPDGQMKEITVDVDIRSDDETLRPAMEQALDNAVANGLLTAEQAAAVLAEVDAAPTEPDLMVLPDGMFHYETTGALDADAFLNGPLGERLDSAVTAGTITQEESQTFRDILEKLLAATE